MFTADCVFFGSPYDAATTYWMGARFGPAAVRKVSQTVAFNYSPYFQKDYSKMKIYAMVWTRQGTLSTS